MIKKLKKIGILLVGNALCAASTVFFIVPAGFISGGVTGLSLFCEQYLHIPLYLGIAFFSLLLLIIAWMVLGKEFAASSAVSAVSYPTWVWIFEVLATKINFATDNLFLNIAGGAILMGCGYALILRQGASSGGLDTLAVILNQKRGISLTLLINLFEILSMSTQVIYSSAEEIMGGVLLTLLYTVLMNYLIANGVARVQVMVYSKQYEKIYEYITTELDRGCTLFHIQGGFTRDEGFALQTIISNRELFRLKEAIKRIDPVAFLTVSRVSEVGGLGFSLEKIYLNKKDIK